MFGLLKLVRDKIGTQAIQITVNFNHKEFIYNLVSDDWVEIISEIWKSSESSITMSLCTLSHDSPIYFVNEIFHNPH